MGHSVVHSSESVTVVGRHSPDDTRDPTHQRDAPDWMVVFNKEEQLAGRRQATVAHSFEANGDCFMTPLSRSNVLVLRKVPYQSVR